MPPSDRAPKRAPVLPDRRGAGSRRARWYAGPLARALARFALVFALCVAPWPGLGRAFVAAVGAVATAIADPLSAASSVTLVVRAAQPAEARPEWDAVLAVSQDHPDGPVARAGAIDLRRAGYLQLATFAALAAAWPPRGRRPILLGVAAGLSVVSIAVALPVLAFLGSVGAVHLGFALTTPIALASRALVAAPGMAYAIPGLAWVSVCGARTSVLPSLVARRTAPGERESRNPHKPGKRDSFGRVRSAR